MNAENNYNNSDEIIIDGFRQGNNKIITEFSKKARPVIFKYVLTNGGKLEDAEKVFQETIVRFWEKCKYGDTTTIKTNLISYVYGIGRNVWMDIIRNEKRKGLYLVDEEKLNILRKESDMESIFYNNKIELQERRDKVIKLIEKLCKACQAVIKLFYYDELSHKEIGEKLQISAESSRTKLSRCLKKLRNSIPDKKLFQ